MNHVEEPLLRLGLVLAGGGSRIRRLVAEVSAGEPLGAGLSNSGLPPALLDTATKLARAEAKTTIERITTAGWQWLIPGDGQYPELLAATADPPLGLFVRGRLEARPTVAIVGSRKATPYGIQVARLLGEELGKAGVVMVSGMARGVDEAAHSGTLAAGGPSWAVWGTGPDRIYPPEHGELAEELAATGALITEYPPGTPPRRHHFPERNRILSGLARAVVVVEAGARSGALITARLAMEEGREVLAVPGNIFSELSVGPNTLLRVGARPLLTPRDLFEAIGHDESSAETQSPPEEGLLRLIGVGEALTADEIAIRIQEAVQRGTHPDNSESAGDGSMPELEDDLFTEEFEANADFGQAASGPPQVAEVAWRAPVKPKRKLSWQLWAAIGGAGIVILGVAMWFGGFFAPAPEAEQRVNIVGQVLAEAAVMYNQKRVEEAILHLEQNSADDPFQTRIDRALNEYRAAIATPVPTPIPEGLTTCRELLEEGRWMAAYERVMSELRAHPNDPGLEDVRQRILEVEPVAVDLYGAVKTGNHQAAINLSKALLAKRPDDSEVAAALDRFLFNAALAELRAFNLSNAESYLTELQQHQPEDGEIPRILEFVETYKTRPIDMQLEIFIGSLSDR